MSVDLSTKFGFRIRTRHGLLVEHLSLYAKDVVDAEKKLRQMYRQCEILERQILGRPSMVSKGSWKS